MSKILWSEVRHRTAAWEHVQSTISGDRDVARCVICNAEVPLEVPKRSRQSVMVEFARKHFYKHKIDPAAPVFSDPVPVGLGF